VKLPIVTCMVLALLVACSREAQNPATATSTSIDKLPPAVQTFYRTHGCNKVSTCGALIEVSCKPEVDGALAYFEASTGEIVMRCGGACDVPRSREPADPKMCSACPPLQWKQCKAG
jgi:hypothetical protein